MRRPGGKRVNPDMAAQAGVERDQEFAESVRAPRCRPRRRGPCAPAGGGADRGPHPDRYRTPRSSSCRTTRVPLMSSWRPANPFRRRAVENKRASGLQIPARLRRTRAPATWRQEPDSTDSSDTMVGVSEINVPARAPALIPAGCPPATRARAARNSFSNRGAPRHLPAARSRR